MNLAVSAAITMSLESAKLQAAPATVPLIAPITGFSNDHMAVIIREYPKVVMRIPSGL